MNETKINELTDQISKIRAILNDLTTQLEAEKNKAMEEKEPSIEDRWKPNMHNEYYSIYKMRPVFNKWDNDDVDNEFYKNYNVWKTETRAEEVFQKTKLLWLMEQIHDILCPDYKPDWGDDIGKFYCSYNADQKIWKSNYINSYVCNSFFDTKEHAEQACKILNDMGVKPI